MKFQPEAIMKSRFAKDSILALATSVNGVPYVRQIAENPKVALAGEWFTGPAVAVNMGYFCKEENREIAEKLRYAFREWIDNGYNDFTDENTILLRMELTDTLLLCNGTRYELSQE